jgi:primosomal protein N' (replication factor Y)
MMCHYCGYSGDVVTKCSQCGSENLRQMGFGTQRMEDELEKLFPSARILRMDADTTFSRYAYEKKFKDFGDGKYDIMIGTQMISKGLDFPNVTLVGVLSIDKALFSGDFRSYERTFSLITQVVGRGGRGNKPGRAYLQTFMPDHYVLNLAACQNYKEFYNEEISIRKSLIFPPICDICIFGLSSEMEHKVIAAADKLIIIMNSKIKEENIKFPLRVLGPGKCAYGKINGKFRYRIILKCKNTKEFRKFIHEILIKIAENKEFSGVSVYSDINGDIGV